jgi:hypothetical protein
MKADVGGEFGFVNSMIKRYGKAEPKLLMCLNRTDREYSYFKILKEMRWMRHCVSRLNNKQVRIYL